MELTIKEMEILAENYLDCDEYSLFKHLGRIRGEGSLESLTEKGVLEDGIIKAEIQELLKVLAYPERVARFHLKQLEVNMVKHAYALKDKQYLVEFHRENVIISPLEAEFDSLRTEISNHTGVAFQKHSQLNAIFKSEALICFAGIADWLRRIALNELTGNSELPLMTEETFEEFLHSPLKLGLLSQIQRLTYLPIPDKKGIQQGLKDLQNMGLVEEIEPKIEAGKSTILLGINFLVPSMAITLELYDMANPEKVLMAREQIIQASAKDNLSISAAVDGYHLLSLTASEVLEKIIGYLSMPILH